MVPDSWRWGLAARFGGMQSLAALSAEALGRMQAPSAVRVARQEGAAGTPLWEGLPGSAWGLRAGRSPWLRSREAESAASPSVPTLCLPLCSIKCNVKPLRGCVINCSAPVYKIGNESQMEDILREGHMQPWGLIAAGGCSWVGAGPCWGRWCPQGVTSCPLTECGLLIFESLPLHQRSRETGFP